MVENVYVNEEFIDDLEWTEDSEKGVEMKEIKENGESDEVEEEEEEKKFNIVQRFIERHRTKLRIIGWVLFLLFVYSYTIAAYVIRPNKSKILFGLVIFGSICGFLHLAWLAMKAFRVPNPITILNDKIPHLPLISSIVVGVVFLALLVYFMWTKPVRKLQALFGLIVYVGLCWICSANRSQVKWRPIIWGLALQYVFAMFILKTTPGEELFEFIGDQVKYFLDYTFSGSAFVFGEMFVSNKSPYWIWAFSVLPTIIFFSAFVSLLFYLGIIQVVILGISKLMFVTMQTSVVESLNAAGNIFVGMTEAPLLIRPFLEHMTSSEIHAVMTGGFATIAGGVLASYIQMGIPAKHLIAASVMSCPAALAISKLVNPEIEKSKYGSGKDFEIPPLENARNVIEATSNGASVAIGLCANILVCLITFLAFYACFEAWFGYLVACVGWDISFTDVIGYIFIPFAWLLGIEEKDCKHGGELLAKKMLLNEFVAYASLRDKVAAKNITIRTEVIMTYALCGFSNIASMGIQVGALTVMAPNRTNTFSKLVFSAMIAGTIACQMTACIAGILYAE